MTLKTSESKSKLPQQEFNLGKKSHVFVGITGKKIIVDQPNYFSECVAEITRPV